VNTTGTVQGFQVLNEWEQLYSLGSPISIPNPCDVQTQQQAWLLNCLRRNQNNVFGIKHRFSQITSIHEYRNQVSLANYDDLAIFVSRMCAGEGDVLFQGQAIAFETAEGTFGKKLIPYRYSCESLDTFRKAVLTTTHPFIRCNTQKLLRFRA
jgi:hypothetical protein